MGEGSLSRTCVAANLAWCDKRSNQRCIPFSAGQTTGKRAKRAKRLVRGSRKSVRGLRNPAGLTRRAVDACRLLGQLCPLIYEPVVCFHVLAEGNAVTSEVQFEVRGTAGFITLDRPKALNALNLPMVRAMQRQLDLWAIDDRVERIVVTGAGGRAFCSGGDIRRIHDLRGAPGSEQQDFFREEYMLDAAIKAYPKPYISLIDGIVMGGGAGISVNGAYRFGTEKTLFAMPETGIGFFCDVGASFFLTRMPKQSGTYCGLTSARLGQADALWAGLLTHAIASEDVPALAKVLETASDIEAAVAPFVRKPEPAPILTVIDEIDSAFSASSMPEIISCLEKSGTDFAKETLATLAMRSPTSLELVFGELRRGAELSFNACMQMEFRIACEIMRHHDFYEGVRSVLVDKDHDPHWAPRALPEVDREGLAAYFRKPECGDLDLPL